MKRFLPYVTFIVLCLTCGNLSARTTAPGAGGHSKIISPTITPSNATGVSTTGATLNGIVNDNGETTAVSFLFGTDPNLVGAATIAANPSSIGAGSGNTPVNAVVSGLTYSTQYYFAVVATNADGTTTETTQTFTTAPVEYSVSVPSNGTYTAGQQLIFTIGWTYITEAPFTVNTTVGTPYLTLMVGNKARRANFASADPSLAQVYFSYTVQPGDYAPAGVVLGTSVNLNGGTIDDPFGDLVGVGTPLQPSPSTSGIIIIAPAPPLVATGAATNVTTSAASLAGTVDDSAGATAISFLYGTDPALAGALTATSSPANIAAGAGNTPVTASLTGLTYSTKYYYQVVGTNSAGTSNGTIDNFTTAPVIFNVSVPSNGTYTAGQQLIFSVGWTYIAEAPLVVNTAGGTPYINVTVGNKTEKAVLDHADPTNAVVYFIYTVQPGDFTASGISLGASIVLNGGAINDQFGDPAGLSISGSVQPVPSLTGVNVSAPAIPIATTGTSDLITATSATIYGSVDDSGAVTAVTFLYGTSPTLAGASTATGIIASIPAGSGNTPDSAKLTGLLPGTTYYYAVQGINSQGTATGTIQSFTTSPDVAPVVTTSSGTTTFQAIGTGSTAVVVDPAVTVTDVDNTTLASATISITSGFSTGDILGYTNSGGITGSYNAATGVLTLTGPTATVAQWQTALQSITFDNTTASPTLGNRTISFIANDGSLPSNTGTKTIAVVAGLNFTGGSPQALTACENSPAQSINTLLTTSDLATGQSLTYSIVTGPTNGTLTGFPGAATSNGANVSPTGLTYTATAGYTGTDAFTISVSNGSFTTQTTINVTVNPQPTVQPITGPATVCASASITLADATSGGTWTSASTGVATIDPSSGQTTGVAQGSAIISYTVTNTFTCTNSATTTIAVNPPPALPSTITGPASVSNEQTGVGYSVTNDPTVTYIWSYSGTGVTINGTTNSVTLDFSAAATSGNLTVTAVSSCGVSSAAQMLAISVSAPIITLAPATLPSATVGTAYTQTITANNGTAPYTYAVTTGALPAGLTLSSNGTLTGTPTAGGSFNFTVTATDASSFTGSLAYTLMVNAATITLTPTTLPAAQVGLVYSGSVVASGGTAPYTYIVSSGSLPAGVSLASDGTFSGTPTEGGSFNFTITATDASTGTGPYLGAQAYTLTVSAATIVIAPTILPAATVAVAYNTAVSASGGTAPYTYAVTSGSLPAGLTLASDGTLSGTPTAGGSFNFTVTATDASSGTGPYIGAQAYTLTVNAATITIAPTSLPAATVGITYAQTVSAGGGTAPYTYAVTSGSLPAGMSLASDGTFSGTPTAGGGFNFTISATDASSGSGPYVGSQAYTLTVNAPSITIAPTSLPASTVGVAYTQTVSANGGTAPYVYSETGALPTGVTLASNGTLSGTPTESGSFSITITATDASAGTGPYTGSQSYTFIVNAPVVSIVQTTLPAATVGVVYNQTITATGGTAPYTYTLTSGSLPAGLTLSSGGALTGTPTEGGSFNIVVTATDASTGTQYSAAQSFTLTVNAATITLSPGTLPAASVGVAYNQTISAVGGTAPYTYTESGALPDGVTLATDGTLSGTPTQGGSYSITITATDASTGTGPYTGSQSYTLTVNAPTITIAPTSLPNATVGIAYTQTVAASGGTAPYTYAESGTLPAGMTFATNGTLSGTPTQGGSFNITITATDASVGTPYTGSQSYTLTVNAPAITLLPATLPAASVGVAYTQTVTASGGTAPYTFTVTGALPAGLTLASNGTLSGTPTAGGTFTFTVTATDASTGTPYTGTQSYSLTVNAPSGITLSPATLPGGAYDVVYAGATFSASGGTSPYTYAVSSGALPAGLTLSSAGVLSGTPTLVGDYTFTVTVTDASTGAGPYTSSLSYSVHIAPATLTITAANQSMTYGGTVPALTITYSGFIGTDNASSLTTQPTVSTLATSASGVGTYPITVAGAVDPNYNIVYVNGTLTINPAELLITATPVTRFYNTPNPTLTYTYSGFVNGDNASVLTSLPTIGTTAVQTSPAGQYPITLSGGGAANYTLFYQDAVLTVLPSQANLITFGTLPVKTYGDPDFTITATASSGLPVRFVSADPTIATVTQDALGNWVVHIVAAGQVTISAFQDGDGTYAPAPEVDQSLQINKASQTITFPAIPTTENTVGTPVTLAATASSGLPVVYTLSDPSIAVIVGNQLTFTGPGTEIVTATQPGNNDYNAATPVSYTVSIFNAAGFVSHIGVFPNPAHGTLHIRFSADYLITKYIIFAVDGRVVRGEEDVTNNNNDLQVNIEDLTPGYYLVRVVCIRNHELVYPVFKVFIY